MNRYATARKRLAAGLRDRLIEHLRDLAASPPIFQGQPFDPVEYAIAVPVKRGYLRVLTTPERTEKGDHLHVSVVHVVHGIQKAPAWEDLVLVRALAWPDDAEVNQVMPPAEEYVNAHAACLHLWGPLPLREAPASTVGGAS